MIQPCYYKGERGNKPYPLEIMLRLYLLQNLYDLSDEATVAEAIDSRAFSEFCSVDSSNQVPDGDTLGRFRNLLIRNGLQEKLFAQVVAALHFDYAGDQEAVEVQRYIKEHGMAEAISHFTEIPANSKLYALIEQKSA